MLLYKGTKGFFRLSTMSKCLSELIQDYCSELVLNKCKHVAQIDIFQQWQWISIAQDKFVSHSLITGACTVLPCEGINNSHVSTCLVYCTPGELQNNYFSILTCLLSSVTSYLQWLLNSGKNDYRIIIPYNNKVETLCWLAKEKTEPLLQDSNDFLHMWWVTDS